MPETGARIVVSFGYETLHDGLRRLLLLEIAFSIHSHLQAQEKASFPLLNNSAKIEADLYGHGSRAVVLAHGGRFGKESWKEQASTLANAGFLMLALRFRGDGLNPDGSPGSFGST